MRTLSQFLGKPAPAAAPAVDFIKLRDHAVLVGLAKINLVDDKGAEPVGINRFIGRRPILAFGNSDGDRQLLEWTAASDGARFMGIVRHTDAAGEWAYDRRSSIRRLDKTLDETTPKGWMVVDMKQDWKVIYRVSDDAHEPLVAGRNAAGACRRSEPRPGAGRRPASGASSGEPRRRRRGRVSRLHRVERL
jgi:hypothetical protein